LFLVLIFILKINSNLNTNIELKEAVINNLDSKTVLTNRAKFKNYYSKYNFMLGVSYYKENDYLKAYNTFKKVKNIDNLDLYLAYYKASSACRYFKDINNLLNSVNDFYSILNIGKGYILKLLELELAYCEVKLAKAYIDKKNYYRSLNFIQNAKLKGYNNLDEEFYLYEKYLKYDEKLALSLLLDLSKNKEFKSYLEKLDKKYLNLFVDNNQNKETKKSIINTSEEDNLIGEIKKQIEFKNYSLFLKLSTQYIDKYIQGRNLNTFYQISNSFILSSIKDNKKDVNFFKNLLEKYTVSQQTSVFISLWQEYNYKNASLLLKIILDTNNKNDRAMYLVASYYEDIGELKEAKKYYKLIKDSFSTSTFYHRSLFKYAYIKFLEKDYKLSLSLFIRYIEEGADDEKWDISASHYYKALSYKNLLDVDNFTATLNTLIKEYPYAFYSMLAREELGISLVAEFNNLKNNNYDTTEGISINDLYFINLASSLTSVLLLDEAVAELKHININNLNPKYLEIISNIYKNTNNPELGISIAYNLMFRHKAYLSRNHIETHYPKLYFDLVNSNSSIVGLDPYIVLSIIKRESAFNKDAESRVGAKGLMQIMPPLAKQMVNNFDTNSLSKPEVNIKLGVTHLKAQLHKYNNNLIYVLSSYNAGDRALERWIKWYASRLTIVEFIESISYTETRNYVKAVIAYYYVYNALYNNTDLKFNNIINNREENIK